MGINFEGRRLKVWLIHKQAFLINNITSSANIQYIGLAQNLMFTCVASNPFLYLSIGLVDGRLAEVAVSLSSQESGTWGGAYHF